MKAVAVLLATLVAMASSLTPLQEFSAGNLNFTARLYNEVLDANPNKNFIFSPISIEIILALTRAGAKGQTDTEFTSALNLPSQEVTQQALKQFLPAFKTSQDDIKLLSANRLYAGQNFQILDSFKSIATNVYDAGIENVDFSQAEQAANIINQWVEEQTNDKIQNLISPDSLSAATRIVLVNALYFSGKWETPFENYQTRKEKFYTSNTESKNVDMMHVEDSFRYFEDTVLNAKFLELPYLGNNISMTIVLPNQKEGLSALESDIGALLSPKNLQYERVAVSLPKFLVESNLPLKPILKKLGLKTIFTTGADLSGISTEHLLVDDVIQKAFINVTESGTEAAAATAVYASRAAKEIFNVVKRNIFNADHPFIYVIKSKDVILFSGKFAV